jgi:hypothetical protein
MFKVRQSVAVNVFSMCACGRLWMSTYTYVHGHTSGHVCKCARMYLCLCASPSLSGRDREMPRMQAYQRQSFGRAETAACPGLHVRPPFFPCLQRCVMLVNGQLG